MSSRRSVGFSLVELLFVVALMATLVAVSVPHLVASLDDLRTAAAARYLAVRLQRVRMDAVRRSRDMAVRFDRSSISPAFDIVMDGNANGVRAADIERRIDLVIEPSERLPEKFGGVDFGTLANLPAIDPSGTAPGTNPIRIGGSNLLTFTPHGTSTSGSLYVRGRRAQYAIRVFGATGKTRVLQFNRAMRQWQAR
jgi:type II secretory pathway pseudopilin PulG